MKEPEDEAFEELSKRQGDWGLQGSRKHQIMRYENAMNEVQRLGQEIQPEPVAYFHPLKGFYWAKPTSISAPTIADVEPLPLYTTPPQRTEQNFCSRCGKRTPDLITIHTCTPPKENT
jgi:hypothetical protein